MKAPEFTLSDKDGNTVSLSDYLGRKVVVYFYPKDNTPLLHPASLRLCRVQDGSGRNGALYGGEPD